MINSNLFSRPMKAENYSIAKLKFPLFAQPKIDGIRALTPPGYSTLMTRTLKPIPNGHTRKTWQNFANLDGELYSGTPTSPSLCRDTTSAVNRFLGTPETQWTVFDKLDAETIILPYYRRLEKLAQHIEKIKQSVRGPIPEIIENTIINSLDELNAFVDATEARGFEGVILRDPDGKYKNGRSTVTEGGLLRIKRFADAEARVIAIVEAQENLNEKTLNELGYFERSSHSENKIGKKMIGALRCTDESKKVFLVGPGELSHAEREYFWQHPQFIINSTITYKYFPHGEKDKPRFPTFKSFRKENI